MFGIKPAKERSKAARQEMIKNKATWLNNLSVTFVALGCFAPTVQLAALKMTTGNTALTISIIEYLWGTEPGRIFVIMLIFSVLFRMLAVAELSHLQD